MSFIVGAAAFKRPINGGNMRSFTKIILAAVLFAASSGLVSAAPTLKVHIQTATISGTFVGVGSVTVAAIEFGMNGPST